jgi:hypothetical protein
MAIDGPSLLSYLSSPSVALAHLRLRPWLPVSVLCSSSSQATQLLSPLRTWSIRSTRIRVLRGHHVSTIQRRIRWALLLAVMLLMMLLLPIGRRGRIILGRRRDLLVLVLRAGGRAEGDLGRGCLRLMMLVLSWGRDGERSGGRSVGGLWRAWASAASRARSTTSPLLAGARSVSGFVLDLLFILLGSGGGAANGQPTRDVVCTRAWHAHWS